MKKRLLLGLLLGLVGKAMIASTPVPEHIQFCGIDLSLDAEARIKIEELVTKIQRYPTSFQGLVDRANIYFPFIEEAFDLRGVPQDLKYIVIQESSINPDAVSPSNAVGYWQFKEESARESGITIDEFVDERKHIFQSSLGAAKYFYNVGRFFDNYVYAVIGYNRGPIGALSYTDQRDYGARSMEITGQTHWYALKAIAHKLAYEGALGKAEPSMWLQPYNSHGETEVKALAEAQGISLEEFKKYNSWIKGDRLPAGKDFIYYIPRKGNRDLRLMRHVGGPAKQIGENPPPKPIKVVEKPKPVAPVKPVAPIKATTRDTRKFDYLGQMEDLEYGVEYVRVKPYQSLVEIAVHNGLKPKKIQAYNGFTNYYRPAAGDIIYLKPPQSRKYHIVQAGESLKAIAEKYETTSEKLQDKNRSASTMVYAGQKLSLKKKVAKGQKPILLEVPEEVEETVFEEEEEEEVKVVEVVEVVRAPVKLAPSEGLLTADPLSYRLPTYDSKIVTHVVGPKESIWKISKQYGCYADVIKKMNSLSSSELKQGQSLKVLQIIERQ